MRSQILFFCWGTFIGSFITPQTDYRIQAKAGMRHDVLCSVKNKDGKAWAGATLILFSKSAFEIPGLGTPDLVTVKVPRNGRLRASVLRGRSYVCWAVISDDNGARGFSQVETDIGHGRVLHLQESDKRRGKVRVVLHGLENWSKHAPLSYEWTSAQTAGYGVQVKVVENKAILPQLPGDGGWLSIRSQTGLLICRHSISLDESRRRATRAYLAGSRKRLQHMEDSLDGLPDPRKVLHGSDDVMHLLVPPPLVVRMKLIDAMSKNAVSGARVYYRRNRTGDDIASDFQFSDKKGHLSMTIPHPMDRWGQGAVDEEVVFVIQAKGYGLTRRGWAREKSPGMTLFRSYLVKDGVAPLMVARLKKGFSVTGRITKDGVKPVVGTMLVFSQQGNDTDLAGKSLDTFDTNCQVYRTGANGEFTIHGLYAQDNSCKLAIVVPQELLKERFGKDRQHSPVHARVMLRLPSLRRISDDIKLSNIDLSKLRFFQIEAQLGSGDPAAFARLQFLQTSTASMNPRDKSAFFRQSLRCDRYGCIGLLAFGRRPGFSLLGKEDYLYMDEAPVEQGAPGNTIVLRLTLKAMGTVLGTVVDIKDRPCAGAALNTLGSSSGTTEEDWEFSKWAYRINRKLLVGTCSTAGSFTLHFIPVKGISWNLCAFPLAGGPLPNFKHTLKIGYESIKGAVIKVPVDIEQEESKK